MSTFKKVVSLMLCFAMLLGTVAVAGNSFVAPMAAAEDAAAPAEDLAEPESGIDSYADLEAQYDNFIYLGLEFYEKHESGKWVRTDYKVQPGQSLKMYFYIKTDMYLGAGAPYIIFERSFFDVTNGATNLTYDATYDPNHENYPTKGYPAVFAGTMNPNHSAVLDAGVTVKMTTNWARNVNGFKAATQTNWHGVDLAESDTWDFIFGSWGRDATGLVSWEAKDDAYYYEYTLKVREFMPDGVTKLADGTTGFVKNDHRMFKRYDASSVTSKRVSNIAVAETQINYGQMVPNNKAAFLTLDNILIYDQAHTFVIDSNSVPGVYVPSGHKATFLAEDGTTLSEATYEEGETIAVPEAPAAKEGFSFEGWALAGTEDIVTDFTMGAEDVTYIPVFEALPEQTATFYVNGEVYEEFKIYAGGEIVPPAVKPEGENGSNFLYWGASENATEEVTDWTMPENGASFYAIFTAAATHNVYYYVNGEVASTQIVIEDETYELAAAPTLEEGYRFIGWSTVENDANAIVTGTQTMGAEDVNIYAIIEEIIYHTVTYYNDGEVYGEVAKYEENTNYTVNADTLKKTGYTFLGWSTVENDADAIVFGEQNVGTADVVLYAVYSANKYKVTFDANNGAFADGSAKTEAELDFGSEIKAPTDLARTGYTFAGWADRKNGTALESLGTVPAKNVTYYAIWTAKTYTVTLYADEKSKNPEVYDEITVKYDTVTTYNNKPVKEGYEFAGWFDENDKLVSVAATNASLAKYTIDGDSSFYAKWTQLSSITVMAKDFFTNEWKVVDVKYGKDDTNAYTATAFADLKAGLDNKEAYGWDGDVYYNPNDSSATIGTDEATATTIPYNTAIKFNGHQIVYIQAEPIFEVEYNVPKFDEATGEYTEEYDTYSETTRPSVGTNVLVPVANAKPADGYNFLGWKTEDGEDATYSETTSSYLFPVSLEGGAKIVVYAKFELKTYDLVFYVGDSFSSTSTVIIKGGFKVGDVVDLDNAEFVYKSPADQAGQTAYIPVAGKENSEQPIKFNGKDGYKFIGYYFSKDNSETIIEIDGLEITEELISKYGATSGDYIAIDDKWEAQSYKAVFKYETADSTAEAPKYETIEVMALVNTALSDFDPYKDAEKKAAIDAATPTGLKFSRWAYDKAVTDNGKMVAGGVEYTAVYDKVQITVYVDYNNGGVPQSLETVSYGDDTMAVGDEYGEGRGIYYVVKTIQLDAYRPTETHESIGWTAYHVHDEADVNDSSKWHEGVNCDGTTEAKTTIIYKNEWKQHGEFLITLYGTDGKIFCGLGKNFKLYFWENRRACEKDDATFIHNPELLILFLKPEFIKDESGLCLKLTPFALNRSLFTFDNIGALFEALGTLLGSLIKGEL